MDIQIIGLKELQRAVRRNPTLVKQEARHFIVEGLKLYRETINSTPWRVGGSKGGSPVKTGNMRGSHRIKQGIFEGSIGPDRGGKDASYARYVHEGTRHMKARPWLDYAKQSNSAKINKLGRDLLKNITRDLAK